ncbi:MAG: Gfo/Idh/MocA family oxidoreductase [Clostridia bacterium]|nr:Gfo/Idh/MocA family oxidoreductase [Clostridia bacterium]
MKELTLGIIGFGGMGGYHERTLRDSGVFRLTALYDTDAEACARAEALGYRAVKSVEELCALCEVVLIATPNDVHLPYVLQCAAMKKHVICEKPVAMSSKEYEQMMEAAQSNGVVFCAHQNRRWDADFLTVREVIRSGAIGEVQLIESRVMGGNGIPGGWRKLPECGGGMMMDWGVHLIDQAITAFSERPCSLYAQYSHQLGFAVDDGFRLELHYKSGFTYRITVDTNTFLPTPRWMVWGKDGTATVTDWSLNGRIVRPIYDEDPHIEGIKAGNGFTKTMAYRGHHATSELPLPTVIEEPLPFYKMFRDAVMGVAPLTIRHDEVLFVLRLMELASRSARENQVLRVDF